MIFTSYYAKLRALTAAGIVPISIALYKPKYWLGPEFKKLAPTPAILEYYKMWYDTARYNQQFRNEVLAKHDPCQIVKELKALAGERDIALLCYETSLSFCHRHIIADWLNLNGIPCEEWKEK